MAKKQNDVVDVEGAINTPSPSLLQRLNKVMKEVETVYKEDKKVNGQYRFVTHDAVTKLLHRPLTENGIMMIPSIVDMQQEGNRTTAKVMMQFVNVDNHEDCVTVFSYGYGIDSQDKGPGKAYSYAVKMGLLKMFMLESSEEDNEADVVTTFNPDVKIGTPNVAKKEDKSATTPTKSFVNNNSKVAW